MGSPHSIYYFTLKKDLIDKPTVRPNLGWVNRCDQAKNMDSEESELKGGSKNDEKKGPKFTSHFLCSFNF